MPYVSDAQRRYFHWAKEQGLIDPETVEKWDEESKGKDLPERVGPKAPKRMTKYTKNREKKAGFMFKLGFLNAVANYIGYSL